MAQPLVKPSRRGKERRRARDYMYTELHVQLSISDNDRCYVGELGMRGAQRAEELGLRGKKLTKGQDENDERTLTRNGWKSNSRNARTLGGREEKS